MTKLSKISLIVITILSFLTNVGSKIFSETFDPVQVYWLEWSGQSNQKNPWEIWSGSVKQVTRDPNYKIDLYPTLKTDQQKQDFLNRYSRSLFVQVKIAGKYVEMFLEDGWKVISH